MNLAKTLALGACFTLLGSVARAQCPVELIVLGAGQDGGAPQIGRPEDRGWDDPNLRLLPTALGVVDRRRGQRVLFEATPAITEQIQIFDQFAPPVGANLGLSAVFLTHAHIGHYTGLIFLGREAASTASLPVAGHPTLLRFLETNGPWSQLFALENIISLLPSQGPDGWVFDTGLEWANITAFDVPHRDEYSKTVGYMITVGPKTVLFVPDIDSWEEYEELSGKSLKEMIGLVSYAFIDATFWDDGELGDRDMSEIPHPRVKETMEQLQGLSEDERAKVHFIHYNHTNPIRFPKSEESRDVTAKGFNIARRGDTICLRED